MISMKKIWILAIELLEKHKSILFLSIFLFAITFRIIYPTHVTPGFDQVQILENSQDILSGDLTLIGPRTGPANMFTGPLIYYLASIFIFIFGDVYSMIIVPACISIITGTLLFFYSSNYVGKKIAWLFLVIWAFSPFIVSLDRLFWNPNLIVMSTILLFFPLMSDRPKKFEYFSILLGSFLAYQAHFSGFMLFITIGLSILIFRRSLKLFIPLILGLFISLVPTILFDFRNNFLNLHGLISFFQSKGEFDLSNIFLDILHNVYIITETTGKIFLHFNSTWTIMTAGLMLLIGGIFLVKKNHKIRHSYLWIAVVALGYAFYSSNKPEYYFLILLPALILISAKVLTKLPQICLFFLMVFFVLSSTIINLTSYSKITGLTISNILEIRKYLDQALVKSIVYDTSFGNDTGIKYFLRDIDLSPSGLTYHVVSPNNNTFSTMIKISDVGIWAEEDLPARRQILTPSYILGSNVEYSLLRDYYQNLPQENYDNYVIIKNEQVVGRLAIAKDNAEFEWISSCQFTDSDLKVGSWIKVGDDQYFQNLTGYCVRVKTMEPILQLGIFVH